MIETLTKNCIVCTKEIIKPVTCSRKDWENRKFCSRVCLNQYWVGKTNGRKKQGSKNKVPAWNKGIKSPYTAWNKGNGEYAKKLGFGKWMVGKKHSLKTRKKQSEIQTRRVLEGKNNFYIDGRTPENQAIRHSVEYKFWRNGVFNRDDYTCQDCGARSAKGKKVYLHAHHIKPFALFPELRIAIDNGITLCDECHYKRHTK